MAGALKGLTLVRRCESGRARQARGRQARGRQARGDRRFCHEDLRAKQWAFGVVGEGSLLYMPDPAKYERSRINKDTWWNSYKKWPLYHHTRYIIMVNCSHNFLKKMKHRISGLAACRPLNNNSRSNIDIFPSASQRHWFGILHM